MTDGSADGLSRRRLLAGLGAVGCLGLGGGAGAYGTLFDSERLPVTLASGQFDLRFALSADGTAVPEQSGSFPSSFTDGPLALDVGELGTGDVRSVTVALAVPDIPAAGTLTLDAPKGPIADDIDLRVEPSSVGDSTVAAASDWTALAEVGTLPLWSGCRADEVVALELALRVTDDGHAGESPEIAVHFQASQCE
ncbi:hypothetical protein SAMN04487949_2524 [Halogranum gelatinilyticum]|uniref:SipW-cognate class signal peptide n=1 Tax=Halogranum gelatinilyticum TaxID=660521 RepID=A0A1G9VVB7_9EURY|nr:hypothetical protein [Halogranum gelatinilyticum]SDM76199.1 hypothetical protein SAMN04487949_2524 [Halogranum gelatinilyticum]